MGSRRRKWPRPGLLADFENLPGGRRGSGSRVRFGVERSSTIMAELPLFVGEQWLGVVLDRDRFALDPDFHGDFSVKRLTIR